MTKPVNPEFFKGLDLKSDPIQIPIKPCCNLVVMSCLVTFPVLELAYNPIRRYSSLALSKISKSVLAGCKDYIGVHSPHWTFFVRNISMRSHLNGEAGEGHLRMCWLPMSPVCYLLQPRHQLAVNGKASIKYIGAHNHA